MPTKQEIVQAGEALRRGIATPQTKTVVDEWRKDHAYPLQHLYISLNRAHKALISQRLKRFTSIQQKLQRMESMSLWQMQDLGGCRVIVPEISDLASAVAVSLPGTFIKKREKNYVDSPKTSGYRSIHHIFSYEKNDNYHGILLEIQYRTRMQHLWATAVEMMSIGETFNVKASEADPNVLRFFADVSSLFAIEEQTPLVPGTPANRKELLQEIVDLNESDGILARLEAKKILCNFVAEKGVNLRKGLFLLRLDNQKLVLNVSYHEKIDEAINAYNLAENDPQINAVLVKAGVFKKMKMAYPNYFMDISRFIATVRALVIK